MPSNQGATTLKRNRRQKDSMRAFDNLPPVLRIWLASAVLPWRPGSVQATYAKALARLETVDNALKELDRIESRLIAKDVRKIWGENHPAAQVEMSQAGS
jgi:hypothetical protein